MAKVGRRSNYHTNVEPYLKQIDEYLNNGATEKQVAEALNVAYSSWNNYKREFPELDEVCRKPRVGLILNLRGALVKEALGYTYEEKKTYIKKDEDGNESRYTEITQKYARPVTNAIFGALNIYDPNYVKDKANHDLKREELELKKELAKNELW